MRPRSSALSTLERAFRFVRQIDEINLKGAEISMREATVLDQISKGSADVPSLSAHLGISSPATKEILDRMEARGFVRRIQVLGRRAYTIEMTAEGKKLLERHRNLDQATNDEIAKRLGKDALVVIGKLRKLMASTENGQAEPLSEKTAAP